MLTQVIMLWGIAIAIILFVGLRLVAAMLDSDDDDE